MGPHLLFPSGYDHISRRIRQKQEQKVLQMAEQEKAQKEAVIQQVTERRAARIVPTPEDPPQACPSLWKWLSGSQFKGILIF